MWPVWMEGETQALVIFPGFPDVDFPACHCSVGLCWLFVAASGLEWGLLSSCYDKLLCAAASLAVEHRL